MSIDELADPRDWRIARPAYPLAATLVAAVEAALESPSAHANRSTANARALLESAAATDAAALAEALAQAPSVGVARLMRDIVADAERGGAEASAALRTILFAIPVVLVTALETPGAPLSIAGVLTDVRSLAAILIEARAFGGCETLALAPSLVAADVLDISALPALLQRRSTLDIPDGAASIALDLTPAPIGVAGAAERVHLRFIAGVILAPPRVDPLAGADVGRWGLDLSRALTRMLAPPGASLLAIPRAPSNLVGAVESGRAAARDVAAQLFASNAIRRLRASWGEPTAIVSAHRSVAAVGGGELRLSLSSPFAPRDAEGFRCPLYPYESVRSVAGLLDALLSDCRVSDVRWMPGVHADSDPVTGGPLFFKDSGASSGAPLQ